MHRKLFALVTGAVMVGGFVMAQPALAAVANDKAAHATAIGSLPFSATEITTSATTDATDAALNAGCGAPATNASVWFVYTPPTDGAVIIDVSNSSYSAGII